MTFPHSKDKIGTLPYSFCTNSPSVYQYHPQSRPYIDKMINRQTDRWIYPRVWQILPQHFWKNLLHWILYKCIPQDFSYAPLFTVLQTHQPLSKLYFYLWEPVLGKASLPSHQRSTSRHSLMSSPLSFP